MRFKLVPLFVLLFLPALASEKIDLAGTWRVALDRTDAGEAERWFARALAGDIALPGSLQTARLGDPVTAQTAWTASLFDKSYYTAAEFAPYREPGNIKVPFFLQPETHYTGAAWYQRTVVIPADWRGRRITLFLERTHWKTSVWIDGVALGARDALSVPHVYELPAELSPGSHTLTLRVDNRLNPDIGENSHSITDHTQGNWNGIIGRIELRASQPLWIDSLVVEGRFQDRTARVRGQLARRGDQAWPDAVVLASDSALQVAGRAAVNADGSFSAVLAFGFAAGAWDEFSPQLHVLNAELPNGEKKSVSFGFREIRADGRQLMINGRKLFLRGALDCAIFPRTGHPPTDIESWKKVFAVIKEHGLNHIRFHSWCPPEAAFSAADELGLYLQIEVASWPNQSTRLGEGRPVDAWLEAETIRILATYGNHPSFVILCATNEPGGDKRNAWLAPWVSRHKAADTRRLYTAGAAWPQLPENDLHIPQEPRIQHWGEGLGSRINALAPETRSDYSDYVRQRSAPLVSHEIGQWCVYPNFDEIPKYTGYLKPKNFEIARESLAANGLAASARAFHLASGKLQVLCYKEDIESALRTPEMGGFQLLGLQDFSGQGTALVGVLDAFWEKKDYVSAREFRRFCNSTVPLARLERRVFTRAEHLAATVEIAHYGAQPLAGQPVAWSLENASGKTVATGELGALDIAVGAANPAGRIDLPLSALPAPARYRLVVALPGTEFANDWDVWVYPEPRDVVTPAPAEVTITSRLDAPALATLKAGGTVWLMAGKSQVKPDPKRGPIALGFSSIFWNTAWTSRQAPHTLGVLCDPAHPALRTFPTEAHSNWQWWHPLRHAAPMLLDSLPAEVQPIVQVIDDWVTNRRLALVFEARVGSGRLLVSSINLSDAVLDPVRRQLRASLLAYAQSEAFQPKVSITPEALAAVLSERPIK